MTERLPVPAILFGYLPTNITIRGYTADQMHEYSDAENAALREQVRVLRDALQVAITQNDHDMLMTGEELRSARAALKASK
jgi:hypothetical protein